MKQPFDYEALCLRSASIMVHSKGKSYAQLAKEVEAIREDYRGIQERSARKCIRRHLDRWLLRFAIDTCQPRVIVDSLYERNVREGFGDLHAEVSSTIEYAEYCNEQNYSKKGLGALQKVKERIYATEGLSTVQAKNFLQATEKSIRRLSKNR